MLVSQKNPETKDPTGEDIFTVGTIAKIKQMLRLPGEGIRIVAQGIKRGRVETFYMDEDYFCGEVSDIEEENEFEIIEAEAHLRMVLNELELFTKNGKKIKNHSGGKEQP